MATFKEIRGQLIKKYTTNPANPLEGQMWYNNTTGTLKGVTVTSAWASSAPLATAREQAASGGTATAGWIAAGQSPGYTNVTEEYNGVGWSSSGNYPISVRLAQGAGPQTAAFATGGFAGGPPDVATTGEYDGTNWTAGTSYPGNLYGVGAAGTLTTGIIFGGAQPSAYSTVTKHYDGSTWTAGGAKSNGSNYPFGTGTETAALSGQGNGPPGASTNVTEEYNGTAWAAGGTNTFSVRGSGASGTQTAALAFGGLVDPGDNTATATYDGSSWTSAPSTATGRGFIGYGSTSISGSWLAGGISDGGTTYGITEEFNQSANVVTPGAWAAGGVYPISVIDFSGAGTQTAAIAFGGRLTPPNAVTNVSATYDGASWTAGPNLTTARQLAASAKNGTTTAALCTGGAEPAHSDKCEEFNGSIWAEGPNYPTTAQFGDQGVGDQGDALISGGYGGVPGSAYLDATSTYNGSTWTALAAPSNLQDSRFSATATGTSTLAVMFAGTGGAGKVESWNGSTWAEQAEALTARTAGGSAGPSTDALYFGGEAGPAATGVTEGWDGTSFSTRPSMGTGRLGIASNGTATSALATGGTPTANLTEEFTGETTAANIETITTS